MDIPGLGSRWDPFGRHLKPGSACHMNVIAPTGATILQDLPIEYEWKSWSVEDMIRELVKASCRPAVNSFCVRGHVHRVVGVMQRPWYVLFAILVNLRWRARKSGKVKYSRKLLRLQATCQCLACDWHGKHWSTYNHIYLDNLYIYISIEKHVFQD